jgi:hypothetical protein
MTMCGETLCLLSNITLPRYGVLNIKYSRFWASMVCSVRGGDLDQKPYALWFDVKKS